MKWKLALRRNLIACLKTIDELVNVICIFLSSFFKELILFAKDLTYYCLVVLFNKKMLEKSIGIWMVLWFCGI